MDNLAKQQDQVLARLERAGIGGDCAPKLNPETSAEDWFEKSNNGEFEPKPKLANEKPQGVTVDYDLLLQRLEGRQGHARRHQGLTPTSDGTGIRTDGSPARLPFRSGPCGSRRGRSQDRRRRSGEPNLPAPESDSSSPPTSAPGSTGWRCWSG